MQSSARRAAAQGDVLSLNFPGVLWQPVGSIGRTEQQLSDAPPGTPPNKQLPLISAFHAHSRCGLSCRTHKMVNEQSAIMARSSCIPREVWMGSGCTLTASLVHHPDRLPPRAS